jgi:hypothetical protein
VQQQNERDADGDVTPDHQDRIDEFLARHGGAGSSPKRAGRNSAGDEGWYEVPAADGYCLRCEWSRIGELEELKFFEVAPRAHAGGGR